MGARAKAKRMANPPTSPSLSSLPDEIIENCLARISISSYRSLSLVSKSFYSLLSSRDVYKVRSEIGNTEPCLYVCLQSPEYYCWFTLEQTLVTNGLEVKNELRLVPTITSSFDSPPPPPPSDSSIIAVGSQIYQIDTCSSAVHVLDCPSHTWHCAPNMIVAREDAKSCFFDGKIFVTGGCRKRETWGEVFDLETQTWKPLPSPFDDIPNFIGGFFWNGGLLWPPHIGDGDWNDHEVVVLGGKLYLISKGKNYAYDPKEARFKRTLELSGLDHIIRSPWCFIEDVIVSCVSDEYWIYNPSTQKWMRVKGLEDLYMMCDSDYCALKFVNYGGKLVIIWQDCTMTANQEKTKRIWCTVIMLEKHLHEIWGKIDLSNVVFTAPESSELFLTCLSASV